MDALATIAVEIQATLTGVLVVALVTILEILDLRRAKQSHRQKIQELSKPLTSAENKSPGYLSARTKKKYCLISTFSLFLQFIFGIIVFAVFVCWALHLINAGYTVSAMFSAVTALVGILMPFVIWLSCRQKNKEMAELIKVIENRPTIRGESEKPQIVADETFDRPAIKDIKPEPIVAAETVAEIKPVPESAPLAPSMPEPAAREVAVDAYKIADLSEKIPEDSMLRRHYLTHIQAKKQSRLPSRPTDSMLRRHYDSLMASLQGQASKQEPGPTLQIEPPILAEAQPAVTAAVGQGLPQDSMLRRHYLATLRYKLESGLPPRPTDSILMRHYESWKNYLIESGINRHLAGRDA